MSRAKNSVVCHKSCGIITQCVHRAIECYGPRSFNDCPGKPDFLWLIHPPVDMSPMKAMLVKWDKLIAGTAITYPGYVFF